MSLDTSPIELKKDLGQFFSGKRVAALLAALTQVRPGSSIIDPMCGTGDLLQGVLDLGIEDCRFTGIEIDASVYTRLQQRFSSKDKVEIIYANAFAEAIANDYDPDGYDLVISNPPYVRYQTQDQHSHNELFIDSAGIRSSLQKHANQYKLFGDDERSFFNDVIKHYSGLADMSLPCWVLCAMQVKEGGQIALVLPETWLSREYSLIIRLMLLRLFRIHYIIEDANAAWFKPTQIKTILLVATRIPYRRSINEWEDERFTFVSLYRDATNAQSLVGNMTSPGSDPEADFVLKINSGITERPFYTVKLINISEFAADIAHQAKRFKWFQMLEPGLTGAPHKIKRLPKIGHILETHCEFTSFEDIGTCISQGLRTGANDFFYLKVLEDQGDQLLVEPHERYQLAAFFAPKRYFKFAIRKQVELAGLYNANLRALGHVVLYIQEQELFDEIAPLNNYITVGAKYPVSSAKGALLIPQLSAVKTNIRNFNKKKPDDAPRFWYMLPTFTRRHLPDLFIPRVNSDAVKTRLNTDGRIVDANFLTIWIDDSSAWNKHGLLALFNSLTIRVLMEEFGTVLGGGALKLDAAQLKKIPIPVLSVTEIHNLNQLGLDLANENTTNENTIRSIDYTLLSAMMPGSNPIEIFNVLLSHHNHLVTKRKSR